MSDVDSSNEQESISISPDVRDQIVTTIKDYHHLREVAKDVLEKVLPQLDECEQLVKEYRAITQAILIRSQGKQAYLRKDEVERLTILSERVVELFESM